MMKLFRSALALLLLLGAAGGALAQEMGSEKRPIDARVTHVKLSGVIHLNLRQGDVPSLLILGEREYVDHVETVQTGDTLHIDTEGRGGSVKRSHLRAELVLPKLRELCSDGIGNSEVSGFSGDELEVQLDGTGSMKVTVDVKRLRANLGGVGGIHIFVNDGDSVELDLNGAGSINLAGRSKLLKVGMGGLGSVSAQHFKAESAELDMSGLGSASVYVTQNLTLGLSGLGSVTVYGKPLNRHVSVDGLGKVTWK